MKLEPANIICPECGNGNYMRHLIGKNVGKLDMKCINCNAYFNFEELYKQRIAETIKPQTNADRIRAMTDEELAEFINDTEYGFIDRPGMCDVCTQHRIQNCYQCWLDWLKQEAHDES